MPTARRSAVGCGKEIYMAKERSAILTLVLCIISFVLALTAAIVGYVQEGEVRILTVAAGICVLAFGIGAWSRFRVRK